MTSCSQSASFHLTLIERLSFPVGILILSFIASSERLVTQSFRAASCPGTFAAAIQLAEATIWLIFTLAERRLVSASPSAIRDAAEGFTIARGGLSQRATAVPVYSVNPSAMIDISATGTWYGPTIWSLTVRHSTDLSPIVTRNFLSPTVSLART